MEKTLEKIEIGLLYTTAAVVPIIALPIFPSVYGTTKLAVLAMGVLAVLTVKLAKTLARGSLKYSVGTFDFAIFLLVAGYVASAIFNSPNKMEALLMPGSATLVVAGGLLYFILNQVEEQTRKGVLLSLYAAAIVISILTLLASSGVLKTFTGLPQFMKVNTFNGLAGSLPGIIVLSVMMLFGGSLIAKESKTPLKAFWGMCLVLVIFGTILSIVNILPGKQQTLQLTDFNTSWVVAIDSLKSDPLLGMGPGNYLTAFNRFRPISYNQTEYWKLRFTSARNYYLTVITETGLVGLAAIILAAYIAGKQVRKEFKEKKRASLAAWMLIILAGWLAAFPGSVVPVMMLFILMAINAEQSRLNLSTFLAQPITNQVSQLKGGDQSLALRLPILIVALPTVLFILVCGYYGIKWTTAEYTYNRALQAVVSNNGGSAYSLLQLAIMKSPRVDRYHTSYAQINLALANSLAQKKREEITEQDRSTMAQLIQQAIREGKTAVALNPERAANWEQLARIYTAVVPFAQNADQFAIQTYSQAIQYDPINPDLRIALGGAYFARAEYDSAVRVFELAVAAKPDYANAHYNLAYALKEQGKIQQAINEMTYALSLVDRNSNDYEVAKAALEDLEAKREELKNEAGENLTPPNQESEVAIEPQIELPEDSEPPDVNKPEPTPSPEPTLAPKATASPSPIS